MMNCRKSRSLSSSSTNICLFGSGKICLRAVHLVDKNLSNVGCFFDA